MGHVPRNLVPILTLLAIAIPRLTAANPSRGTLTRRQLSAPAEIQSYPCAAGYTWFFPDGKLAECAVSREIVFGAIAIPAKSWINLTHDGDPDFVFLAHDIMVNGYLCKGGSLLGPTEGASTALYPGGKLKTCWLAADSVVDGVPCARASFWADALDGNSGTYFHENGKLESCRLSREFTIGDRIFRRGDQIHLDAAGKPETGTP